MRQSTGKDKPPTQKMDPRVREDDGKMALDVQDEKKDGAGRPFM
jgi:hypothetical protein